MKTTWIALLLLLTEAAWTPTPAQTVFEGIVESRNTTTDEMGEVQRYMMTLHVKGDKVRTEIAGFGSPQVLRGDERNARIRREVHGASERAFHLLR